MTYNADPNNDNAIGCTFGVEETNGIVLMHNSNDLPSSTEHSPILTFNPTKFNWEYTIEKTTTSMEPTKQNPCGLLYSKECEDYQINVMIEEIYNCQIPFFQTGQHVNVSKDLPHCTNQIIIEAFELRTHAAKRCSDTIPCKRSSNKILHSTYSYSYWNEPNMPKYLKITMSSKVESRQFFVDYKFANLLNETGGIMGLFLGWSFLSLVLVLVNFLPWKKVKSFLSEMIMLLLLLGFCLWSKDLFQTYWFEEENLDIELKQSFSPPFVTLCPGEKMSTYFSCFDGYELNFKEGVKNCLITGVDVVPFILENMTELYESNLLPKMATLTTDQESLTFKNIHWKRIIHENYGLCFTLHSSYWKRYTISNQQITYLSFIGNTHV